MKTSAIVLATSDTGFGDAVGPHAETPSLVEIGGESLADRVVRAAREACTIGPLTLVQAGGGNAAGADCCLESSGSLTADLLCALGAVDGCAHTVLLPGNIPFTNGAEIDAFVAASLDRGAQMTYPLIERGRCEAAFPEFRRSYFRLAEGELTGANALFLHVPTFLSRGEIVEEAVALRREPWRLALMVDPRILFSFGAGRMSLADMEAAAERALGIAAAAVVLDVPGLATDVQKPIDLRAARARLG